MEHPLDESDQLPGDGAGRVCPLRRRPHAVCSALAAVYGDRRAAGAGGRAVRAALALRWDSAPVSRGSATWRGPPAGCGAAALLTCMDRGRTLESLPGVISCSSTAAGRARAGGLRRREQTRDFIYVADLVRAIPAATFGDRAVGGLRPSTRDRPADHGQPAGAEVARPCARRPASPRLGPRRRDPLLAGAVERAAELPASAPRPRRPTAAETID
jgi:hypothetical protein